MQQETIHAMNDVLDIANETIEEDQDYLAITKHKPTELVYTGNGLDLIEDYAYARDTLKKLISSGEFALAKMEGILKDSDSARTFEVFSTLIKSIADLTTDLIKLQKQMKDIAKPIQSQTKTKTDDDSIEMTTDQLNAILNKNK